MDKYKNAATLLDRLVSEQSVFPNEYKLALLLEKALKSMGFELRRNYISKSRWNILAERGEGINPLLFYGHMDTVPPYGKWKTDPYILTQIRERLYGLGSCDMKGGIAAFLHAISKTNPKRKLKILLTVDEENISEGAWAVVKTSKAWFKDVGLIISAETGASPNQTGGANVITLGRRGRVVFSVEVFGKSSHGAQPYLGTNAISEAAIIISALETLKFPKHKLLGSSSLFARKIESFSESLSIPEKAHIEIDRHLVMPETIESARSQIERLINNLYRSGKLSKMVDRKAAVLVKERKTPYLEPYITTKNAYVAKIPSYMREHHQVPIINYGSSVGDENVFAKKLRVPIITIGPAGGNLHEANEWVSEKSLEELAQLYSFILQNC